MKKKLSNVHYNVLSGYQLESYLPIIAILVRNFVCITAITWKKFQKCFRCVLLETLRRVSVRPP